MVEFYYHDNQDTKENFTQDHRGEPFDIKNLTSIGVIYRKVDTLDELNAIAEERNYRNRDEVKLSLDTFGGDKAAYNAKMEQFYEEHYHEDEEIRYIVEGEGYFDVRDQNEKWVRAKLFPKDLLILPAGIYHRFTLTEGAKYVHAMRLFKDEPKWEAINRSSGYESDIRTSYAQSVSS